MKNLKSSLFHRDRYCKMNLVYYVDLGNTCEGVVGSRMGCTKMTKMAKNTLNKDFLFKKPLSMRIVIDLEITSKT